MNDPSTLLSPAYIAGLFDVKGNFKVHIYETSESDIGYYMSPSANLIVPDKSYLPQHTSQFLDAYEIAYSEQTKQNGASGSVFYIKQPDSLRAFADITDEYLIANLEARYIVIDEILPQYEGSLNSSKELFYIAIKKADRIRETSSDMITYTADYFAEEWANELHIDSLNKKYD